MIELWLLTVLSVFLVLIVAFCLAFLIFNFLGDLLGAPFVPTSAKALEQILQKAHLKKGQVFFELGSGDGRLVIMAAQRFRAKGIGIEVNPLLFWYSLLMAKLLAISNLQFRRENLFNIDLSSANVVFFFLTPSTIKRLAKKITDECKANTLIISHGFRVKEFDRYLVETIERPVFSTYFYRLARPSSKNAGGK